MFSGTAAFLGWRVSSRNNTRQQTETQQPQTIQQTSGPESMPSAGIDGPKPVDTDWNKVECAKPKSHDEADLCEQRRMSQAAENTVWLSKLQIALGVVGAAFVLWSLYYTRVAAAAAITAAKAAQDAIHADRAWMTFSRCNFAGISGEIDGKPVKRGLGFQANWQNTGRSPAIGVQAYLAHKVVGVNDPIPTFEVSDNEDNKTTTVGPGVSADTIMHALDDEQFTALRHREIKVYIYSRVLYFDIFTKAERRFTEVCAELEFNGESVGPKGPVPQIGVGPVGPQNSAA